MAIASARGKLIGVIGDEDTCVGFLLGGIGKLTIICKKKEREKYSVPITSPIGQMSLIELYHTLGEMNKNRQPNFLVVNTETPMSDIEGKHCLKSIKGIDNSWVTILK